MSHLSQSVSDAIANATGVGGSPPMHQPSADRVKVERDGKIFYVVCMAEEEMQRISDALDIAYDPETGDVTGDGETLGSIPDALFNALKDRFAV